MATTTAAPLTLHEWAVEVDTYLAILWNATEQARHYRRGYIDSLHRAVGHYQVHSRSGAYWAAARNDLRTFVSAKDAIEKAQALVASEKAKPWDRRDAETYLARVAAQDAEIAALVEAAEPFEAEWDELRWSRFFLVKNNNGHIHESMNCSTCNRNGQATSFGWLPNLSGLTEADAVAEHGTILCSVCFPSAPVEWTLGRQKDTSNDCPASGKYASEFVKEGERLFHSRGPEGEISGKIRPSGMSYYWVGECPGGCGQKGVTVNQSTLKIRKHQRKKES